MDNENVSIFPYQDEDDEPAGKTEELNKAPYPIEARKRLVTVALQTYKLTHDTNWKGLQQYANCITKKYPDDKDLNICVRLASARQSYYQSGNCKKGLKVVNDLLGYMSNTCDNMLTIGCLCEKAYLLYKMKQFSESRTLFRSALQMSGHHELSIMSLENAFWFSKIVVFEEGDFTSTPTDDTWRVVETFQQHFTNMSRCAIEKMKSYIETDNSEEIATIIFLRMQFELASTLMKSRSRETFFPYENWTVSAEKLTEADKRIREIEDRMHTLSFRSTVGYYFIKADYFIRAGLNETCQNKQESLFREAYVMVGKISESALQYKDPEMRSALVDRHIPRYMKFLREMVPNIECEYTPHAPEDDTNDRAMNDVTVWDAGRLTILSPENTRGIAESEYANSNILSVPENTECLDQPLGGPTPRMEFCSVHQVRPDQTSSGLESSGHSTGSPMEIIFMTKNTPATDSPTAQTICKSAATCEPVSGRGIILQIEAEEIENNSIDIEISCLAEMDYYKTSRTHRVEVEQEATDQKYVCTSVETQTAPKSVEVAGQG